MATKVVRIDTEIIKNLQGIDKNLNVALKILWDRRAIKIDYDYLADEITKRVIMEIKQ